MASNTLDFKYKTNWCVITGAPSSGKTSVIDALKARGFAVENEVARELIELALRGGRDLRDVRGDVADLQRGILEVALAREMELDPHATVFLDRGIPDSLTYLRLAGLDVFAAAAVARLFRYRAVFIFDRLPVVQDNVRTEDAALAEKIDKMLEEDYRSAGYAPVRVPVMPVAARADFILERLRTSA
ncbi:MAG: ATP-binding protein [Alphaproteobacteria bacterium]|nr:AAA family ATPase [Alphaproteobacteria bacterium]MDE2336485.1 ATP-binding protein [Alphaproteobacteria bacterium]